MHGAHMACELGGGTTAQGAFVARVHSFVRDGMQPQLRLRCKELLTIVAFQRLGSVGKNMGVEVGLARKAATADVAKPFLWSMDIFEVLF